MEYVIIFIAGLLIGAFTVYMISRFHRKEMEKTFSALSNEVFQKNTGQFLQIASQTLSNQARAGEIELEGKKKLIDQTLEAIKSDLQSIEKLVKEFEQDRATKFGEISSQLKLTAEQTARLQNTTSKLQAALASTKIRGQWGERMAEDVLMLAGFVEGINYMKQQSQLETMSRPDYTFLLPQNLKLNMDVKFPLDNYLKYLSEESEEARQSYKDQFLRDARQRIREVSNKDYINPEENTLDYVLVFIPNEQVYCFINENDHSIIDEALTNNVILCSPFTLYAILALIRRATYQFNLRKTAGEILILMNKFYQQWSLYGASMDKMGKKLEEASKEYHNLITTRSSQLEKILLKIDALRTQGGLPEALGITEKDDNVNLPDNIKQQ